MSARRTRAFGGAALFLITCRAFAGIDIGAGASIDFGNAALDLGCSNLSIAGQAAATAASLAGLVDLNIAGGAFAPGASSVSLGGNFAGAGAFAAGASSLRIVDACGSGVSQISGATRFHDLIVTSANGKQLVLPANATQNVAHALTLQGVAGNLLRIVSSVAGQRAQLALANGAAQTVAYVDARDNAATLAAIAPGPASSYHSVDAGNLGNWFANGVGSSGATMPAPMLSPGLLALLGLLFGSTGSARLAKRYATA